MTPAVRTLLIATVGTFFFQKMMPGIEDPFVFVPQLVLVRPWSIVTYMFLHGGLGHLFFNMLALFIFGPQVEGRIGTNRFVVVWADNDSYHIVARRLGLIAPQNLLLAGRSLLLKNPPAGPEKNRGVWTVTDPGIVAGERETSEDPRCNGAPAGTVKATLRFASPTSGHESGTIDLPCENWVALGSGTRQGYKYADLELDDGPCKLIRLTNGKLLKAVCLGSGATTDFAYDLVAGTDEGIVNVVLTVGTIRYCTAFDDFHGKNGSDGLLFKGLNAPAPAACP